MQRYLKISNVDWLVGGWPSDITSKNAQSIKICRKPRKLKSERYRCAPHGRRIWWSWASLVCSWSKPRESWCSPLTCALILLVGIHCTALLLDRSALEQSFENSAFDDNLRQSLKPTENFTGSGYWGMDMVLWSGSRWEGGGSGYFKLFMNQFV